MCVRWPFFHGLYSRAQMCQLLRGHSLDSKLGAKWKFEKEIQEIKIKKNIAYSEARKLIVPQSSQTYAPVTKPTALYPQLLK
ncbi:hypothetical protein TNCV_1133411 [Trichonephila clavipes]|nr:hypothetical protein TNCV_1133411 [Trichonephila clavipes]